MNASCRAALSPASAYAFFTRRPMLDRIEGWPREVAALRALSVAPPRRALKTSRAPCRRDSIGYARSAVRPDAERWLWENDERPWEVTTGRMTNAAGRLVAAGAGAWRWPAARANRRASVAPKLPP